MTIERARKIYIPSGEQIKSRQEDYSFVFDPELPSEKLEKKRAKTKESQAKFYKKNGTKKKVPGTDLEYTPKPQSNPKYGFNRVPKI